MESERSRVTQPGDVRPAALVSWHTSLLLGLITLILGVIIAFRPTQSLVAIAVLLGVVMIISGSFHLVRALGGRREHDRVWRGISGVLFILTGLVLLRHLHLSVALIGLFIGFTWVIQGVSALIETFSGGRGRTETGWSVFFGIISLIAGIVVIAAPIASVATLTIFMGAWIIVMGVMEIAGALAARSGGGRRGAGDVSVPSQRADAATAGREADVADAPVQPPAGPAGRNIPR